MLTVGSLFSGIGGLDLGLERAGMSVKWQVEIDDYCNRVLAKHWPDVARFRDVRDVGAHNLEAVDLICGGFPCQDVSLAGQRAGLEGKRSTLWSEFARIIGELRPRWVLAENVPGLLSSDDGRFFGNVLRDLAACGYDAEWDCIPAAAVGAPHRRDRVFIIAHANGCQQGRGQQSERSQAGRNADAPGHGTEGAMADDQGNRWGARWPRGFAPGNTHESEPDGALQVSAHADEPELAFGQDASQLWQFAATTGDRQWAIEPNVGRVVDGTPSRVDQLRCLGNAVVPQVAEWIGRRIVEVAGGE